MNNQKNVATVMQNNEVEERNVNRNLRKRNRIVQPKHRKVAKFN